MITKVQIACCLFLLGTLPANPQTSQSVAKPSVSPQLSPVDGIWEGELKFPARTLRFVVRISGSDNGLVADADSPDQNGYALAVNSIALTGSTLTFEMARLNVAFSGDLQADGSVSGTFVQRGLSIPLVLTRSRSANPVTPNPPASGSVTGGRYHNDQTGIEFDLPAGFSVLSTSNYFNNN